MKKLHSKAVYTNLLRSINPSIQNLKCHEKIHIIILRTSF